MGPEKKQREERATRRKFCPESHGETARRSTMSSLGRMLPRNSRRSCKVPRGHLEDPGLEFRK